MAVEYNIFLQSPTNKIVEGLREILRKEPAIEDARNGERLFTFQLPHFNAYLTNKSNVFHSSLEDFKYVSRCDFYINKDFILEAELEIFEVVCKLLKSNSGNFLFILNGEHIILQTKLPEIYLNSLNDPMPELKKQLKAKGINILEMEFV